MVMERNFFSKARALYLPSSPSPVFCSLSLIDKAKSGVSVSDITQESNCESITVQERSLKSWPATPGTKTRSGKNTAQVVRVEESMAQMTSLLPFMAASLAFIPSWLRKRNIFSVTTTPLSISIPTPRASPPMDMVLIVIFVANIRKKTPMTVVGMATITIKEA